jgi:histidine decarboxylase
MKILGPGRIYAGIALGIATDRRQNANLLMEDMGLIPDLNGGGKNLDKYKSQIITNLAKSVLEIGSNQKVEYSEIFTGIIDVYVNSGEVGCALVAAPYILLAQNALPKPKNLLDMTLDEWESEVL